MHIRMYRHYDGMFANVHPDMVADYAAGGFAPVSDAAPINNAPDDGEAASEKRGRGRPRKEPVE